MKIWELCEGSKHIKPLTIDPWRVVEAQHILSSRDLVDTGDEHDQLEALIEASKPEVNKEKNYLIFTPFRYPPLKYGSRFGNIFEPSLWYGSLDLETAFTEVAYYRLKFFSDTTASLGYVEISMTAYTACLESAKGIDLTAAPFHHYTSYISDKHSYENSQLLGTAMREAAVEAFIYFSARTQKSTKNLASYTPAVFNLKKNHYVNNQQTWKCLANRQTIEFTRIDILGQQRFAFSEHYFASSTFEDD
jgi:hypothetical protein